MTIIENQVVLTDERLMDATEKYAALYDDDPRQNIKTDVMNAFYAGAAFARNGEGVYELLRKFLDFADAEYVPNYLFEQARALLAAPAAPAPTDLAEVDPVRVRRTKESADKAAVARVRAMLARPEMSVEALKKRAEQAKQWDASAVSGGAYAGIRRERQQGK